MTLRMTQGIMRSNVDQFKSKGSAKVMEEFEVKPKPAGKKLYQLTKELGFSSILYPHVYARTFFL